MNETEAMSRDTENRKAWLWAVVAIVCMAGLLSWLALTTESSSVQVVEGGTADQEMGIAVTVPLDSFVTNVDRYVDTDTRVRLSRIPVASKLGSRVFWTQLPGERPGFTATYLIALDSTLVSDSAGVSQGQALSLAGRVRTMTDTVLTRWIAAGLITEEQRLEASFATSFLRADALTFPDEND